VGDAALVGGADRIGDPDREVEKSVGLEALIRDSGLVDGR
jgi:hypothetical protein